MKIERQALSSQKQLKIGALISYSSIAVNVMVALLYTPWMIRQIGQADYGLYTLSTTAINMFLIDFGIGSAVSRFVSKYHAENNQEKIDDFLGMIYKLFALVSGIIFLILIALYFFIGKIYTSLTPEELEKFKVVYIIGATYGVVSFPFSATLNGILNSYEKFIQMKTCDLVQRILTVLLIAAALFFGLGLYALVTVHAVVGLVLILIRLRLLRRSTPIRVNFTYFNRSHLKEVVGFSMWVTVSAVCSRFIMNITPSILGITSGAVAISIFGVASALEGYTYLFSSAVDGMFMPKISRIVKNGNSAENLLALMKKVGRFQFSITSLIVVGFVLAGKEFISLWLGPDFSEVYLCGILLLLPAPFYLSQQVAKTTVVVLNKVKYQAYVNLAKSAFNVIAAVILSYFFGATGACVSICIAYFIRNMGMDLVYRNILKIDMLAFYKSCYFKNSISIALTMVTGFLINHYFKADRWLDLGIKVLLYVVVYFIYLWTISMDAYEKGLVKNVFKRVKRPR